MRADLVLKQTGIIKRRTVAKTLLENGHIMINNKVAKPSTEVRNDDIITLSLGQRILVAKITFVVRGKKEIPSFEMLSSEKKPNES
ncbi:MAG TPA: S4 domain-containing protein [Bacilli bacterium]|nr:S4 domain-containing protein [Bacilli bacterium]HPS18865.1 S4 domain-containing protein [Bacilli bacterium]